MSDQRFTADRDGWYQITPDGLEYIGPERPADTSHAMLVKHDAGGVAAYQNSGGALDTGQQVIPNETWTQVTFDTVERCWFDAGMCACDHRPGCIPDREASR